MQFSFARSLMRRHSSVVRHSSQLGVAVRVTVSNRLLQSVITSAGNKEAKPVGASLQVKLSTLMIPHIKRIQLNLSTPFDMEKASALKVERTTLAIFFDDQNVGEIGATKFLFRAMVVAAMNTPWKHWGLGH